MAKTPRKFDVETMNTVEFIGIINIAFLLLIIIAGIPTILTHQWTIEATGTELLLIFSALFFNFTVVLATHEGRGNTRIGLNYLLHQLQEFGSKVMCRIQKLSHQIFSLGSSMFMKSKQVSSSQHTPIPLPFKTNGYISEKSNSEPVKFSAKRKGSENGQFLSIKEKYMPLRSPELFKNKIYVTRRSLINSQDDILS